MTAAGNPLIHKTCKRSFYYVGPAAAKVCVPEDPGSFPEEKPEAYVSVKVIESFSVSSSWLYHSTLTLSRADYHCLRINGVASSDALSREVRGTTFPGRFPEDPGRVPEEDNQDPTTPSFGA